MRFILVIYNANSFALSIIFWFDLYLIDWYGFCGYNELIFVRKLWHYMIKLKKKLELIKYKPLIVQPPSAFYNKNQCYFVKQQILIFKEKYQILIKHYNIYSYAIMLFRWIRSPSNSNDTEYHLERALTFDLGNTM